MARIYIIESVPEIRNQLFYNLSKIHSVRVCESPDNAFDEIFAYRPDLLIIDFTVTQVDLQKMIDRAFSLGIHPHILGSTAFISGRLEMRLQQYNQGVLLFRPFTVEYVVQTAMRMLDNIENSVEAKLRRASNEIMLSLGFAPHQPCYCRIREAIVYVALHPNCLLNDELYPYIINKFGGSSTQVEKAIRDCVRKTWELRDDEVWNLYFPHDHNGKTRKVSSGKFIKRIAHAARQMCALDIEEHN